MSKRKYTKIFSAILVIAFVSIIFVKSNSTSQEVRQESVTERGVVPSNTTPPIEPISDKSNEPATKTSASCTDLDKSNDFSCYQDYYAKLVKEKGVPVAFTDLTKRYEGSIYARSQCHPLAHVIGHAGAKLYPEVSVAFQHGDPFCWSGYYHGVMEEITEKVGVEKITSKLDNLCSGITGKASYSFDYYNCVHGLGHGLMSITDNNLFKSLDMCDSLSGDWEETSCYGGAFMENIMIDNKNHFTKYLKPAEPLYPCNAVEEKYKTSCYLMQTSYMLKVTGQDFSKVFALCREADAGYEVTCFQSLGRDASGQSLSNADATKAKCALGADYNEKSNCIIGAVKDFISYYHSDKEANVLCAVITEDLRKVCLDTATTYYKSL